MTAYQPEQWHDLFVARPGRRAVLNAWIMLVEIHR